MEIRPLPIALVKCPKCKARNALTAWPCWRRGRSIDEWEKTRFWTCPVCKHDWELDPNAREEDDTGVKTAATD